MNKFRIARAGINVNEGIERLCGDVNAFEAILSSFPNDTHYQEFKDALAAKDVQAAFSAAHALKGIAGNMSMTKLHETTSQVVEILRSGSLDVAEYIPAMDESYEKVIAAIEDMNANKK